MNRNKTKPAVDKATNGLYSLSHTTVMEYIISISCTFLQGIPTQFSNVRDTVKKWHAAAELKIAVNLGADGHCQPSQFGAYLNNRQLLANRLVLATGRGIRDMQFIFCTSTHGF